MKIKNFIFAALMQGIMGLSYAQNAQYPPINRSTSIAGETISQTNAPVDSAIADSSTHDSTQVAGIQHPVSTAENHENQGEERMIFGFPIKAVGWAITGLILLFVIFAAVAKWARGKKTKIATNGTVLNSTQIFANNVKTKIDVGKVMLADVCTEKVDLNNNKHVRNFKNLMIFFRDYDKMWLKLLRYAGVFVLGSGVLYVLYSFAITPDPTYINQTIVAADTSKFVPVTPAVKDRDQEDYHEPASDRDDQTVATHNPNQPMMVYVPPYGESKPVYIQWGDKNDLREKSGYYQVTVQPGYVFNAKPLSPVSTARPDNSSFAQNPNDTINSIGSGLTGKRVYSTLTPGQATNVEYTIKPI